MDMKMYRIWALPLISMLLTSCSQEIDMPTFCGFEDGTKGEKTYFDFDNLRLLGSDTSYGLEILQTDKAKGFVSPFPLSLPTIPIQDQEMPTNWELNNFRFSVVQISSEDPDWLMIYAQPIIDNPETPGYVSARWTSVLYSVNKGVLAIRVRTENDGI